MVKHVVFSATLFVAMFFAAADAPGALTINLDFSSFSTGAPADGSVILGGRSRAQAQAVIQQAANVWETAFANSSSSIGWSTNVGGNLTQNIAVQWGSLGGSTLATGGTGWFLGDGRWAPGAALTWDNDGSSRFYVDETPTNNSEWNQSSQRDMTFSGVAVNVERVNFDASAGVARDNSDMLSVAVHEIGHSLGYLGSFPAYSASDLGADGDVDITSGFLNGAEIPVAGGHTSFTIQTPSTQFPYDPGGGSFFPLNQYGPNALSPSLVFGTRKNLTEADIVIAAQFLQFDMGTVNFNPSTVPEPSFAFALGLLATGIAIRQRRKSKRDR